MIQPRQQPTPGTAWADTQTDPMAPSDAAPASPISGLEISEIDSDTAFDRLFGPDELRPGA